MKQFSKTRVCKAMPLVICLVSSHAYADAVTDWNLYTHLASKGANASGGSAAAALNSNVTTRLAAIESRAVFDAVNAVNRFSRRFYYSRPEAAGPWSANSASAAAIGAAHDVVFALQSNGDTRAWLDAKRDADLSALGLTTADPGYVVGQAAASAALAARVADFSAPRTTYTPSTNLSINTAVTPNAIVPNATGNPGRGVWRPSNGAAGIKDPATGAPTGFDPTGAILPAAGIDFNWKNVAPFSLKTQEKRFLVAAVPGSLKLDGEEYAKELDFVRSHGQDSSHPGQRTADQTLQALYYKADAELFVNEAARAASSARGLDLNQNAKLFALLDSALADARIAAWQSKYDLLFWRPVTALNADAAGGVTNGHSAWRPLATTPSHPASTSGHSTTVAAGAEILRSFFRSDLIDPTGSPVSLTIPAWLIGTNNGTGQASPSINGKDGTSREVATFSTLQLENGQSRIYLGVHWGIDNYQGQALGLTVADQILLSGFDDPAAAGIRPFNGGPTVATLPRLKAILVADSVNSGYFGGR